MGCGSSTVGVEGIHGETQTQSKQKGDNGSKQKRERGGSGDHKSKHRTANGVAKEHIQENNNSVSNKDSNANSVNMDQTPEPEPATDCGDFVLFKKVLRNLPEVLFETSEKLGPDGLPKSVAFDVGLDGKNTSVLPAPPRMLPRRLQTIEPSSAFSGHNVTLEPLDLPKLSAEQLAEKQRQADEKRNKMLQKRASASKKASKRRQELMKAKEFEQQQQVQQEKALDHMLRTVEMKREARLREIQDKQKLREERAKRARERARKLHNAGENEDIDVEKDDHFNASDDDSWLGDDKPNERGVSEPHKRAGGQRHTASASTVDSYDAAFQRQGRTHLTKNDDHDEDFFGS